MSSSQRQGWGPDTLGLVVPVRRWGPLWQTTGQTLVGSPCSFRRGEGSSRRAPELGRGVD